MSTNYTTTNEDPDAIRADIERTRSELSRDVNALGESVTPGHLARRGAEKVKGRAAGLKDTVFGSASDAGHSVGQGASGAASSVSGAAHDATQGVKRQARGNPLAAGAIALAAGWLVGSILPATQKEQQLAETVKDKAEPVIEKAQETAKQVAQEGAEHLKEPAQQAVQSVKAQAQDSVETVKQEGQSAAQSVGDSAKEHARDVKDENTTSA